MKIESPKPVPMVQEKKGASPKPLAVVNFYEFLRALITPYGQAAVSRMSSSAALNRGQQSALGAVEQAVANDVQAVLEETHRPFHPPEDESLGVAFVVGDVPAAIPPSAWPQLVRRSHASALVPVQGIPSIELPSSHAKTVAPSGDLSQLMGSFATAPQARLAVSSKGASLGEPTDTTVPRAPQVISLPNTTERIPFPMMSSGSIDVPTAEGRVQGLGNAPAQRVADVQVTVPRTEGSVQLTADPALQTGTDGKAGFPLTEGRVQGLGNAPAQRGVNAAWEQAEPNFAAVVVAGSGDKGLSGASEETKQGAVEAKALSMARSSAVETTARSTVQPGEAVPAFTGARISPPAPITEASLVALRMEIISFVHSPSRPQVTLEIHPPEYGRVLVSADMGQERGVTVRLIVENSAVREQVLVHLQRLPLPAEVEVMTFEEYRGQDGPNSRHKRERPKHQPDPEQRDKSVTEFKV